MNKTPNKTKEKLLLKISQLESEISELEKSKLEKYTLLENLPVCTKIIDLDFNLQFMNSSGIRALKIEDITAFYGKPFPLHFYPDSFKIQMTQNLKRVKKTCETLTQEAPIKDIKGNILWCHSTISPVYNSREKLDAIMIVSIKTNADKKTEEALKQSEGTLRNKLNILNAQEAYMGKLELSNIIDVKVLKSLMDDFYKLTGMPGAVLDVSGKVLVAVGWQDICTKFHRCNPDSLKNCIESDTLLTQNVSEGTFKAYRCKNNMWDIVTPIIVGKRHVGNVFMGQYFLKDELPDTELFRKQARKYGFNETAYLAALDRAPRFTKETVEAGMKFYSKLAGIISTLSYNAIQQSKMLAERKKAEEEILKAKLKTEKSEEKYKLLFERDTDAIFIYDAESSKIIEANKATSKLYGYSPEELLGKSVIELSAEKEKTSAQLKKIKKNGQIQIPLRRHKKKDGSIIYVHVKGFKIILQGKEVMFAISKNITEKVLVDKALKKQNKDYKSLNNKLYKINEQLLAAKNKAEESDERFKLAMAATKDGLFDWNLETNEIYYSPGWKSMLGYEDDELPNDFSVWEKLALPEDIARIQKINEEELINKQRGRFELKFKMQHKDGHWVDILSIAEAVFNENGKAIRMVGTHIDISERKKAEDKIHTAEKKLKDTFDLSPSIISKVNLNTGYFVEVNKAVTRMLGYTPNEFTSKPFIEFIHPDDRLMTEDKRFEKQKFKKVTYLENRYICKDGSFKWISWNSTKVNKNGVVTAIGSDTTERKLAQLKLNRSTQLLEASQSIAKLGGWELDISSNNLFWTAETYRIHETSPEEFNPTVDAGVGYFLPESRRLISNALEAAIKNGEEYDLELETFTTKGHLINVRTTCKVTLRDGKPIKLTGIFQDITEQKKVERQIRAAEENLKNTFDLSPSIICKGNVNTGYFIEANLAVKRILGYSFEEFTSKPFVEFVHPDDRKKTIYEMSELQTGKKMTFFENRYLCKNGSYKWMAWYGSIADKHGIVTAIASDISERKIIEHEIIKTKQFYENIIEGVQDGIWVTDKNDVIFYANLAMEKIAGIPPEKIKGKNILKDLPEETIGEFNKFYTQAKKEKKPVWYEIKAITPGGKNVCQNGWLIPQYKNKSFNGIICTVRDISERKKAEINVRKLSTAVQQSPSTIIIADTKGILEYVNPKFLEVTGYSKDELIGKNLNIFKSGKQDSAFYKEMWGKINSGKVWRGQFHNKKKNGEFYWDAASISAIYNESGDVINFIKIGEDITPQKKTETDLKIALEKALESDRLKSAFLSNMSHEIRTPMNGILGFINLLNEPNLSKSQISQYSAIINKSGERLLNTINDIIDISKIEAGQVVIYKTETSINTEIEELYSFFLPEAKQKGLSLFFNSLFSNERANVVTDSSKLHGILTNLIKNAIKFTEKGTITFGYLFKDNFIEFYVKDTGIGIPKERLKAIFNRFEQADIEDVKALEGSGLGLAISKAYVTMLGGEISVESAEGKGSKFVFTIPYLKKAVVEPLPESIYNSATRMENLNLLVAEDDEVSSELLKMLLSDTFPNITFAQNGKDALEICRNNLEIDLVLMDLKMPKMNGYEATKEIRKFNKELFIIAQTAYAMPGDKEKAINAGCNDCIVKPINKELLLKMINNLLD